MRRSVRFPAVFLSVLPLLFLSNPRTVFASRDLMILPDPRYDSGSSHVFEYGFETEDETESDSGTYEEPDSDSGAADSSGTDAVLVIDVSGSMKQSDPDYLCRKAAMSFIEDLSQTPGSRAALITFSDTLQTVIPLTDTESLSDENELMKVLNGLSYTAGDTDIGAAMEKAASVLMQRGENTRAGSILLLTDGEIDLPAAENEQEAEKESLTRALIAVEEAKKEGIVIHTVALDLSGHIDTNLLNYMADSTGGTSNVVNNASALNRVFRQLSESVARLRETAVPEEESEAEVQTEKETETQTETETETEMQALPAVAVTGSIDGPVRLRALLPGLCTAELKLSDLFFLDRGSGGFPDSIRYTAYSDDRSVLNCRVEGDLLLISGLKNGTSKVQVIAEPSFATSGFGSSSAILLSSGAPDSQASLSFTVEIDALIPSLLYLLPLPAAAAFAAVILLLIRKGRTPSPNLTGRLQWYVRGENEKIFGMPTQTMADLRDYGTSVRLSELVKDELLSGADLSKVVIRATWDGILIISRSSSCLIAVAGGEPERRLAMTRSGRFKVFCESGGGNAAVIAYYTAGEAYRKEPSPEDDSERTRLLV